MARPDQPLLILRFRRRRPLGARADPRAAAERADRLCRGQRRLSLWHQEPAPRSRRGCPPCSAGSPSATIRADRHRLQHRLDDRARRGAGGARPADRRHGAGDQAGGRCCRRPARSACSAPTRPSSSPMSTGSPREFAADCIVIRHGSAELVELAEAKLRGEAADPAAYAAHPRRPARPARRRADRHDRPRLHPFSRWSRPSWRPPRRARSPSSMARRASRAAPPGCCATIDWPDAPGQGVAVFTGAVAADRRLSRRPRRFWPDPDRELVMRRLIANRSHWPFDGRSIR